MMENTLSVIGVIFFGQILATGQNTTAIREKVSQAINQPTSGFVKNIGQIINDSGKKAKQVLYALQAKQANIYLTNSGISYLFTRQAENKTESKEGEDDKQPIEWCRVDMRLLNAVVDPAKIITEEPSADYQNYYLSPSPTPLKEYRYNKIIIQDIYPHIDWILYTDNDGFRYDFVVHPGASSNEINISYSGADSIRIDTRNNMLHLRPFFGELTEGSLHCYQEQRTIEASYKLNKNLVQFNMGAYDKNADLTIDPPVMALNWATYYGADVHIGPRGLCTDKSGNIFVTGYTDCSFFPLQNPGGTAYYNGTFNGNSNMIFILKFNSAGVRQWATYFGGATGGDDVGAAVATDVSGDLFLGATSSSGDMPLVNPGGGTYSATNAGPTDAYFAKFDPNGALLWGTYFGGTLNEQLNDIDVDASGNMWATGWTESSTGLSFPTVDPGGGAYYNSTFNGPSSGTGDAFILKFSNNCVLLWSTYYGGTGNEEGYSISAAPTGDILVTGFTSSVSGFPLLNPGGGAFYQGALAGDSDLFIARFSNTCVQKWSTYYGGSDIDGSSNDPHTLGNIFGDRNGNVYVTGATKSTDFPTFNPGGGAFYQSSNAGGADAFILKFGPANQRLWATYYGGSSDDEGNSIVTDTNGNIFVTGQSLSSALPTLNPGNGVFYQAANTNTNMDIFINEFDPNGVQYWGTFFGGNNDDWSTHAVINPTGCLLVTGEWNSSSGITTVNPGGGAFYQSSFSGGIHDGYIMQFCPVCTPPTVRINPPADTICKGDSLHLTASGATTYTWMPSIGLNCTNCPNPTAAPSGTTTYKVVGVSTGVCKDSSTITITVDTAPVVTISPSITINKGDSTTLTATGGGTYQWSPATGLSCTTCQSPVAKPTVTTTYCATVTSPEGCAASSVCTTVTIEIPAIPCGDLFVPNAFSPNGDGTNDALYVEGNCISTLEFAVYDRWGNKVFETQNQNIGWDGTYMGKPMNTGNYVYTLNAAMTNNTTVNKKGSIALVR
jgi:gliding motility-associated-like protein